MYEYTNIDKAIKLLHLLKFKKLKTMCEPGELKLKQRFSKPSYIYLYKDEIITINYVPETGEIFLQTAEMRPTIDSKKIKHYEKFLKILKEIDKE